MSDVQEDSFASLKETWTDLVTAIERDRVDGAERFRKHEKDAARDRVIALGLSSLVVVANAVSLAVDGTAWDLIAVIVAVPAAAWVGYESFRANTKKAMEAQREHFASDATYRKACAGWAAQIEADPVLASRIATANKLIQHYSDLRNRNNTEHDTPLGSTGE